MHVEGITVRKTHPEASDAEHALSSCLATAQHDRRRASSATAATLGLCFYRFTNVRISWRRKPSVRNKLAALCHFCSSELTLICAIERTVASWFEEAKSELICQMLQQKRQYALQHNILQPIYRLSGEIKSLSLLTAKDQLSIMRVCQHFRVHVIDTPSLWTHVERIQNSTALSFVIEHAKSLAVDITHLFVGGAFKVQDDHANG